MTAGRRRRYYRTDLFEQVGAEVPETWEEFLDVSAKLKAAGITPITIGTKFLWTAAGWFDYLNLRINGLDYHISLTDGEASYLDPELDAVFAAWRELIDRGYFLENHATYSWQEAQAPLINGNAAMYLIGNFIVPDLESAGVVDRRWRRCRCCCSPSSGTTSSGRSRWCRATGRARSRSACRHCADSGRFPGI